MKSTGDSESPYGVSTVVLNGTDSASSTLMVMFVADNRSHVIRTLSVTRNECKTLRSFSRRIVWNARDRSRPSISITYLYRCHLATSHRCPQITSAVDRPRRNPLWDGETKSSTLSEIRCSVRFAGFLQCYQYPCSFVQRLMFLENIVICVGDEYGKVGRCVLQKFSWNRVVLQARLLLSLANGVTIAAVIGESSDFGGPSNMLKPCPTPS